MRQSVSIAVVRESVELFDRPALSERRWPSECGPGSCYARRGCRVNSALTLTHHLSDSRPRCDLFAVDARLPTPTRPMPIQPSLRFGAFLDRPVPSAPCLPDAGD